MAAGTGGASYSSSVAGVLKLANLLLIPLVVMAFSSVLSVDAEVQVCKTAQCIDQTLKSNDRVVIAVYGSPCYCDRALSIFNLLSGPTPNVKFVEVNQDEVPDMGFERATEVPTFFFFQKGLIITKVEGIDMYEFNEALKKIAAGLTYTA